MGRNWIKRAKRRFLPLMMSIAMLLAMLPAGNIAVSADTGFAGGNGTSENPYQITTAEQLDAVRDDLNAHYILMNDIDLTETVTGAVYGGEGWEPIGMGSTFNGTFDGNGHTITGLYINRSGMDNVGLFSYLWLGTVKNLGLSDASVTGNNYTGGLAGINNGTISNCYVTGASVTGGNRTGGLAGTNSGTISNCYVTGRAAGLEGRAPLRAGGLVGQNEYGGTITNCYAMVDMINFDHVGGLVGANYSATITNCYAAGAVTGESFAGGLAGGLVGINGDGGTVTGSCYNRLSSGQSDTGKGTPLTSAEMVREYTFAGWDFGGIWDIDEGVSYPYLRVVIPDHLPAPPAVTGVTVSPSEAVLDYEGGPFALKADFIPADGLADVAWSSSDESVATVDGNGNVTPGNIGNAVITATTAPGGFTSQAVIKVRQELTVAGTFTAADKDYDGTASATILENNLTLVGLLDGDQVGLEAVAAFEDTHVGKDKTVSLTGASSLDNIWAGKYVLSLDGSPTATADITNGYQGSGTDQDPWKLATAAQLDCVRYAPDAHYILTDDIDLTAYLSEGGAGYNEGAGWEPIGDWGTPFNGTLDGDGHTITGLFINLPDNYNGGLFGVAGSTAGFRSLGLLNVDVTNSGGVGGLVGYNFGGTFINCYAAGTVEGSDCAGGLVGYNEGGSITDCYATGTVKNGDSVGGLVGCNYGGNIINCYATGTVEGGDCVGGLVGYNEGGSIANCYAANTVADGAYVGGLVGYSEEGTVTGSYYDRVTSGQSDTGKGEPKTSAEMKRKATFSGWDFTANTGVWRIFEDCTYPALQWQPWTADESITLDRQALTIIYAGGDSADSVTRNLTLPTAGANGTAISWSSNNTSTVANDGTVTRPSYSQGDKTVILTATVSKAGGTAQTMSYTLTVKALPSDRSGGGNSGGNGGGTSTVTLPAETPKTETPNTGTATAGNTVTATTTATATVDNHGKATATVTQTQVSEAIRKASEEAARQGNGAAAAVEIKVEAPADVKTVEASIPKEAVNLLADGKTDALTVSTPIASITFDSKALSNIAGQSAEAVKITVSKAEASSLPAETQQLVGDRPVFDFSVTSGDKIISQFGGNVSVAVPYTPKAGEDTNAIVIYYINAEGKAEIVSDCVYDPATGMVNFSTNHFSRYAVGYNKVNFKDVAADTWYGKAVGFIAARGISSGTGSGNYSPDAKLTRGEFLVMMMRAYGIAPDGNPKDNFADSGNTYYTGYLAAAKRLGISGGVGNNLFEPGREITRQEMFTLLYNGLKAINRLPKGDAGKTLSAFSDAGQVASWAKDAMTLMAGTGAVSGSGGKLSPSSTTTRAEMAQVLYNLLSK